MTVEQSISRWVTTTDLAAGPHPHRLRGPVTTDRMAIPIRSRKQAMQHRAEQYWRHIFLQIHRNKNHLAWGSRTEWPATNSGTRKLTGRLPEEMAISEILT